MPSNKDRYDEIEARLKELDNTLQTRSADITFDEATSIHSEAEALKQEKLDLIEQERQAAINAFDTSKNVQFIAKPVDNKRSNDREFILKRSEALYTQKGEVRLSTMDQRSIDGDGTQYGDIRQMMIKPSKRAALLTTGYSDDTTTVLAKPTAVDGIYNNLEDDDLGLLSDVTVKSYTGYKTITHAYQTKEVEAFEDYVEGTEPTESQAQFKTIEVSYSKIAGYTQVSRSLYRDSPLDYYSAIYAGCMRGLHKKLNDKIITKMVGSYNTASEQLWQEASIGSKIGATTIRDIVFTYAPGRTFNGLGTLYLSRKNLAAFGALRGVNEYLPAYRVTYNNTITRGVIDDNGIALNYVVVDSLGDDTMIYGFPKAFELDTWGDVIVEANSSVKFLEGIDVIRYEVWAGGAPVVDNAFVKLSIE